MIKLLFGTPCEGFVFLSLFLLADICYNFTIQTSRLQTSTSLNDNVFIPKTRIPPLLLASLQPVCYLLHWRQPTDQAKLKKAWLSHQGRPSPGGLRGAPLPSSSTCFWLACTQVVLPLALRYDSNSVPANSWCG